MSYLSCRYHEEEFPSEGEIVIGKISKVTELGVFIEIIEYNNLEGLIVVGELTRKRINNAQKAVRPGKIEVAMVSRVDSKKKYIDLSRIKVTSEEREQCFQSHYKNKAAHNTMITIAKKLDMDLLSLYESFGWPNAKKHNTLYNYFVEVLNNPKIVSGHEFEDAILEGVRLRFKASKLRIGAKVRLTCFRARGILCIKEALLKARAFDAEVEITLVKPPIYSVSKTEYNAKKGIGAIKVACNIIRNRILELGGDFSIFEDPAVFGETKDFLRDDENTADDANSSGSTDQ